MNPITHTPMWQLHKQTEQRKQKILQAGFGYVEIWEHEFTEMKKHNNELQTFLQDHTVVPRLSPRDAFYGGRTNASRLYYEGTVKYIDFTSLYPWVNKYCPYPVGHPEIITENFKSLSEYFGLIQCTILPPRSLFHPVLPFRSGGKLIFPLCRTCTIHKQQDSCKHTDQERSLLGGWLQIAHTETYVGSR